MYRTTITLDEDAYAFLQAQGTKNRSRFINTLLRKEQQATLAQQLYAANLEEAADAAYQQNLSAWDTTLSDGLAQ